MLEWIWVGTATLAVVVTYVWLDRLGNRWFQALPEPVRRHGILGLAVRRLLGKDGRRR
jgi:hypothetical protein